MLLYEQKSTHIVLNKEDCLKVGLETGIFKAISSEKNHKQLVEILFTVEYFPCTL